MPEDLNKEFHRYLQWSERDGCWVCDVFDTEAYGRTVWEALQNSEHIIDEWLEASKIVGEKLDKEFGYMSEHKLLGDLETVLTKRFDRNQFCLAGFKENALCIQQEKNGWSVFVGKNGKRQNKTIYHILFMACLQFIRLCTKDETEAKSIYNEYIKLLERNKYCPQIFSDKDKQWYLDEVYKEMARRNIREENIPKVINRTGFLKVLEQCTEEQFHYAIESAVDEILEVASQAGLD